MYGGRWHSPGKPIVYTSATVSLASLEVLVHVTDEDWPQDLCAIRAVIPPHIKIQELKLEELPRGWRRYPAPPRLRDRGDTWLAKGETLVLGVPSAVIPMEKNYLLNPAHPNMKDIQIGEPQRFQFDMRLQRS